MKQSNMTRREILASILPITAAIILSPGLVLAATDLSMTAYRNPGCGCCEKWAQSLKSAGITVKMIDDPNLDGRRSAAGVPADLAGCHTGILGEYVIEGHVPGEDIIRFLNEKPVARGLAVAGMPVGSPGMEGTPAESYEVILFSTDGSRRVFAKH